MSGVDEPYSRSFTALAVTHLFKGSPHIDRQNVAPFYALSLGNFAPGTGVVSVECSARVTARVDTRGKVGRVDGRFPHWVSEYEGERWSLVWYRTEGEREPVKGAVFAMPEVSTEASSKR